MKNKYDKAIASLMRHKRAKHAIAVSKPEVPSVVLSALRLAAQVSIDGPYGEKGFMLCQHVPPVEHAPILFLSRSESEAFVDFVADVMGWKVVKPGSKA